MFRFFSRRVHASIISGTDHFLRLPQLSDYEEWKVLREESRAFLQPWEPSWGKDDLSKMAFRRRVERSQYEYSAGTAVPLFLFNKESGKLLGGITVGHIRRGAAQCCMLGYWMGERHSGQGHMHAALSLVIHHIFTQLQLRRIEAACIPDNERSITLLEKAGFQREGLLRDYLKIDGRWREHVLMSLLATDLNMPQKDKNGE